MTYLALVGKQGAPPPLSTGEAVLAVSLILAGIALALLIALMRARL